MDYSLKLFIVMLMVVIAALTMFIMLRRDETTPEKRMQKIPVPIDDGRRRRVPRIQPQEEEQSKNIPYALYLGFLFFAYLLFLFLRFA